MLTVPASLSQTFESQLSLRNIPDQQRRDCHKWLRFYLDFCAKNGSSPVYCHLLPNDRLPSIAAGTVRQINR